jgi:hypothetical protein
MIQTNHAFLLLRLRRSSLAALQQNAAPGYNHRSHRQRDTAAVTRRGRTDQVDVPPWSSQTTAPEQQPDVGVAVRSKGKPEWLHALRTSKGFGLCEKQDDGRMSVIVTICCLAHLRMATRTVNPMRM